MERTAYLVAHVDTKSRPPTIVGTGVYSSGATGLTGVMGDGVWAFDVAQAKGEDYEDARRKLIEFAGMYAFAYGWALELLPKGDREAWGVPGDG